MANTAEIAYLKADVLPIRGREVYWLLSKGQLEHIVQEVVVQPVPFAQKYLAGLAEWQGLALPVVSLEAYFNFTLISQSPPKRRVVVRSTVHGEDNKVVRMLIDVHHDLRISPLDESFIPARISRDEMTARGLKGVFEWKKDKLMLIPDLAEIASGGRIKR